jgi:AcrR family transcriptional regulator
LQAKDETATKYVQKHIIALDYPRFAQGSEPMPYSPEHSQQVRARILRCARQLFTQRGFSEVSIDEVMAKAGLTRGGFYNHFRNKEELCAESLAAYAQERRADGPGAACAGGAEMARELLSRYVSRQHLEDTEAQCPLMALPSDVARAGPTVRAAYREVLEALAGAFEACLAEAAPAQARRQGLALAAMCVGAMALARTIDEAALADEICAAARTVASDAIGLPCKELATPRLA